MATGNPPPIGGKDFEQRVVDVRKEIETHFTELIESARSRQSELLKKVDSILRDYREKVKEENQTQKELDATKELIKQNIQVSGLLDLQADLVSKIEERVQKVKKEIESWDISFSGDKELIQKVKKHGQITFGAFSHRSNPSINYKSKLQAIKSFGTHGSADGQFSSPWGVAIDVNTSHLFIADHYNSRVQVFSQEGQYLYKFGDGDMNHPVGVVIYQDKVFVTQYYASCLQVYKLDGTYVSTVGSQGSGKGQLNNPYGVDINKATGDIYICDAENNRVQIFSQELQFKQSLWANTLTRPVAIKLTDESIFLLDESNTCLHIYNHNHALVKSIITRGTGKQIVRPFVFCIDAENNIYMTDSSTGKVNVFDIQGTSLHQFGKYTNPTGITLSQTGAIIICGAANNQCIHIW